MSDSLFRQQAMDHHFAPDTSGSILRVGSRRALLLTLLLMATLIAGGAYLFWAPVNEYVRGPAMIRLVGDTPAVALADGSVANLRAAPGMHVRRGDELLRLHDELAQLELEQARDRFRRFLVQRLRAPEDDRLVSTLLAARNVMETAEQNLETKIVRAPRDGVIAAVRTHVGALVGAGMPLVTLAPESSDVRVLALLPGRARPRLAPGMPLVLRLDGYPQARIELELDGVGERLAGPSECRRLLGDELHDTLGLAGPLVMVEARVSSNGFELDGQSLPYHHGMVGQAEVAIERERLFDLLFPGESGRGRLHG